MTTLRNQRPVLSRLGLRRLPMLFAVGVVTLGVSGCAIAGRPARPRNVTAVELANGAEPYFWAGPVTYQVQVSRQLNPFDTYDVQYMAGVKTAQDLNAQQFWFGVFLWAKNQTNHNVQTADKFRLLDSAGDVFYPVHLNPSINPFAWTSQTLSPGAVEPADGSIAAAMSTAGGMILFKLNQGVYANRPLTLQVFAPGSSKPSDVSLDL